MPCLERVLIARDKSDLDIEHQQLHCLQQAIRNITAYGKGAWDSVGTLVAIGATVAGKGSGLTGAAYGAATGAAATTGAEACAAAAGSGAEPGASTPVFSWVKNALKEAGVTRAGAVAAASADAGACEGASYAHHYRSSQDCSLTSCAGTQHS